MRHRIAFGAAVLLAAALLPSAAGSDDIEEVRARATEITQALSDAETRVGELEQEIAGINHEAQQAEQRLADLESEVQRVAVARYTNPQDVFLVGDDADLNRQATASALARMVTQGDVDAIDDYAETRQRLGEAETRLGDLIAEQEEAVTTLQETARELEAELLRLEELERQRRAEEERRRREAAERAAAEAAAEEAAREAAEEAASTSGDDGSSGSAATTGGGSSGGSATTGSSGGSSGGGNSGGGGSGGGSGSGFVCPVPNSTFIDSWGAPRSGGRSHQGVDMMAPHGAPIYAPVSGTVLHRGVSIGGLSFFLYGNDGNTYFGTHLSSYAAGGSVSAGTVIGYVGATGNAGTPHLHFEVHPGGGSPVNPTPYVSAVCPGG